MKRIALVAAIFLLGSTALANGAQDVFDRLAADLPGSWLVESPYGKSVVNYELIANGSVLKEELHDMVTMYHVDGDSLLATHYCSAGNQPRMRTASLTGTETDIRFEFEDVTGHDPEESHMTGIRLNFNEDGTFAQTWTAQMGEDLIQTIFLYAKLPAANTISTLDLPEQYLLAIERPVTMETIGATLAEILPAVKNHLEGINTPALSMPAARYLDWTEAGGTVQGGFFVGQPLPEEGEINTFVIPATTVLKVLHVGGYDTIHEAHAKLDAKIAELGWEQAGAPWEVYISDPGSAPENKLLTEVYYPVVRK